MSDYIFPTKSNLISTKKSLSLAKLGYDLLDRKRNILVREMMQLMDSANEIQNKIDQIYSKAYKALELANITLGFSANIAETVPVEEGVEITYRSVMGVSIPSVKLKKRTRSIHYGFLNTNSYLDDAYLKFHDVKMLTVQLAEAENCIYRLADAIKKVKKRANALKNIIIPRLTEAVKNITLALEEKEREEFTRMKVIKYKKNQ